MTERRRFSARRYWLAQIAVVVVVGLVAFAYVASGRGHGGGAELVVTYTPVDGGAQVSERVVVERVSCIEVGGRLTYGDAEMGRAQVSAVNVQPSEQGRAESSANLTIRFGEDLQFYSAEPFTSDATGFRLQDHPGAVVFVGEESWQPVSTDATVSGTLTC